MTVRGSGVSGSPRCVARGHPGPGVAPDMTGHGAPCHSCRGEREKPVGAPTFVAGACQARPRERLVVVPPRLSRRSPLDRPGPRSSRWCSGPSRRTRHGAVMAGGGSLARDDGAGLDCGCEPLPSGRHVVGGFHPATTPQYEASRVNPQGLPGLLRFQPGGSVGRMACSCDHRSKSSSGVLDGYAFGFCVR